MKVFALLLLLLSIAYGQHVFDITFVRNAATVTSLNLMDYATAKVTLQNSTTAAVTASCTFDNGVTFVQSGATVSLTFDAGVTDMVAVFRYTPSNASDTTVLTCTEGGLSSTGDLNTGTLNSLIIGNVNDVYMGAYHQLTIRPTYEILSDGPVTIELELDSSVDAIRFAATGTQLQSLTFTSTDSFFFVRLIAQDEPDTITIRYNVTSQADARYGYWNDVNTYGTTFDVITRTFSVHPTCASKCKDLELVKVKRGFPSKTPVLVKSVETYTVNDDNTIGDLVNNDLSVDTVADYSGSALSDATSGVNINTLAFTSSPALTYFWVNIENNEHISPISDDVRAFSFEIEQSSPSRLFYGNSTDRLSVDAFYLINSGTMSVTSSVASIDQMGFISFRIDTGRTENWNINLTFANVLCTTSTVSQTLLSTSTSVGFDYTCAIAGQHQFYITISDASGGSPAELRYYNQRERVLSGTVTVDTSAKTVQGFINGHQLYAGKSNTLTVILPRPIVEGLTVVPVARYLRFTPESFTFETAGQYVTTFEATVEPQLDTSLSTTINLEVFGKDAFLFNSGSLSASLVANAVVGGTVYPTGTRTLYVSTPETWVVSIDRFAPGYDSLEYKISSRHPAVTCSESITLSSTQPRANVTCVANYHYTVGSITIDLLATGVAANIYGDLNIVVQTQLYRWNLIRREPRIFPKDAATLADNQLNIGNYASFFNVTLARDPTEPYTNTIINASPNGLTVRFSSPHLLFSPNPVTIPAGQFAAEVKIVAITAGTHQIYYSYEGADFDLYQFEGLAINPLQLVSFEARSVEDANSLVNSAGLVQVSFAVIVFGLIASLF